MRSGKYINQLTGDSQYKAFVPNRLPFELNKDPKLDALLSEANLALGRLDGVAEIVPDVDFLTLMFARKEATFSSQVEGTQATFADVLKVEAKIEDKKIPYDVQEILNYIEAMNYGLKRLVSLPLSLRLLREIHAILLQNVRGAERQPGEFKTSQNWIGGPTINTASFVPAPPYELMDLLSNFEKFLHEDSALPVLVKTGLIHSQFENIHPFLDGNGRLGRLLITFFLCQQKVLQKPLLYLSVYFKKHQKDYYYWLNRVHNEDDIEGWLKFFLQGVTETAKEGFETAQKILKLRNIDIQKVSGLGRTARNALMVLDSLYKNPMITLRKVVEITQLSRSNAYSLLKRLETAEILSQLPAKPKRTKAYVHRKYLSLFN
jgi:Fic family protein